MANEQYLQSTHIPMVVFQASDDQRAEVLPDWLNVGYGDLHEQDLEFGYHIVGDEDLGQPDAIAWRYYGDSNWWWLILSFNGIVNPMTDLVVGQRIKIPSLQQSKLLLQKVLAVNKNDLRDKFAVI